MSVQLMDRLARAMQYGYATMAEHEQITDAMTPEVQQFEQLPPPVQHLVVNLEHRARTRSGQPTAS